MQRLYHKNLSMVWIDIQKAFDSVSHEWIIKVLQMYETHPKIISLIEKIIYSWTITLEIVTAQGKEHIGPIKVHRGIMQGDDFSILLHAIGVDPISWPIRSSEGYRLTHEKNDKVKHLLFVDDLKCYTRSEQKLVTGSRTLANMLDDIGLDRNHGKWAACHIKRSKCYEDADLPVGDDQIIKVLEKGDKYRFLGKAENCNQLDSLVYKETRREYL